ncbi:hypothetical protein CHS0354_034289 [Potamilus streckersoni]|uniref:Uncharacterized protein n=1 Tax=Potamilus streckersoni TaxID=2493646 RepID=A0AAE0S4B7_9BIVA|nr:hypothetical protein CHS0354_034289 [Potamilus streckersoni]
MARSEGDKEYATSPTSLHCYVESILNSSEIDSNVKLMKNEWARYISFGIFPRNSPVHPNRLSKSGVYYTGQGDETVCFSCGFRKKNWKAGESPSDIHTRLSSNCNFANGTGDGNIPILDGNVCCNGSCRDTNKILDSTFQSSAPDDIEINERQFEPLCTKKNDKLTNTCNSNIQYSPTYAKDRPEKVTNNASKFAEGQSMSCTTLDKTYNGTIRNPEFSTVTIGTPTTKTEDSNLEIPKPEPVKQTIDNLGIHAEKAKHPHYSTLTSRLESFRGWPSVAVPKPSQLAAAGLYYVGVEDCVRCFYCGGGLRSWEEGDDPWEEHARWYHNCAFLKQFKGEDFVLTQLAGINMRSEDTLDMESHDLWGTCDMKSGDETCNIEITSIIREAASSNSMDSQTVQSVLSMGYSLEMVRQAMQILESMDGHSKILVNDLLEVIFEIEEAQTSKQANEIKSTNYVVQRLNNTNGAGYRENISNKQNNTHYSPQHNNHSEVKEQNDSSKSNLSSKELESLLEQNQELKDQMTCKICMDREIPDITL